MGKIHIYTDGSCSGNPGLGGWAAITEINGKKKIRRGNCKEATNNGMELMAALEAVRGVNKANGKEAEIIIHTDSTYLIKCWEHENEWFGRENRPNRELWLQLIAEEKKGGHKISFVKVAGHSGDRLNELADKYAKEQVVILRHELFG